MLFKKITRLFTATATVFLLFNQQSFAQFHLVVGPKGGFAITSFAGDDAGNVKARTSGLGGLFLNLQFGEVFNVQPEFLISQRGATQIRNNVENNISLTYFDIPVLAKLRLPIDKVFYPHILLGPDFAFNTNTKVTSRDTQSGQQLTVSGGDFNKTDVGALAGVGIDFQSKRLLVNVDARYGYAFNSLGATSNGASLNYRNAGWSFTAGVGIRLFNLEDSGE